MHIDVPITKFLSPVNYWQFVGEAAVLPASENCNQTNREE